MNYNLLQILPYFLNYEIPNTDSKLTCLTEKVLIIKSANGTTDVVVTVNILSGVS